MLLNGWSAPGVAWPRSWIRELHRDFRVIRVDNRGAGWSRFAPTPFTMRDLAEDVASVLDEAGIERALVLGFSMGGMIAQELAMWAPERVAGLVLVSTAPPLPAYRPASGGLAALALFRPPLPGQSLESYFQRLWMAAAAPGFQVRDPEMVRELVAQLADRPTPRWLVLHQLRAVFGWGHAERLAAIAIPTTVVHGAQDRLVEPAAGRRLAELIPGAQFRALPHAGHLVPFEAPGALRSSLLDINGGLGSTDRLVE